MDTKKLWDSVLVEIELEVSKASFSTWFKDTYIAKLDDGVVYLSVPNAFVKDWLANKYHKPILKSLRTLSENVRTIEYVISKNAKKKEAVKEWPKNEPAQKSGAALGELPLGDFYIDKEDNLNPRYTFDTFIVGSFNQLAHAAAQAIISRPGAAYNPFFVYGGTGHGKTHLIQAIGNHLKRGGQGKKVYYISSDKFSVDYVNAMQANKINIFKEKFHKFDVFIMDDIQFLSRKEKTQEELFHLFNAFHENNKQIIFSSDKHPNFIPDIEDRLRSRFAAGMMLDIPSPDHESRIAILKSKSLNANLSLNDEIIDFLAVTVEGNIRELEGVFNSILLLQSQLAGKELNLSDIKNLVKNTNKTKKSVSIKEIVKIVANFYNIEEAVIYEKTRRKEVVRPRQIAMYILRDVCNTSFPLIGQKFGGRDHTTVIHSYEKIKEEMKNNNTLSQEVAQIKAMI